MHPSLLRLVHSARLSGDPQGFSFRHRALLLSTALSAMLLAILISNPTAQAVAPSFAAKQDFAVGTFAFYIKAGDLNGDGKLDLAVSHASGTTVSVLLNTTPTGAATYTFAAKQDFPTGAGSTGISITDFNGDGMLDLAVASNNLHFVSVFLNTTAPGSSTISFAPRQDFPTSFNPQSVEAGDFNLDGRPDLAVVNGCGGCDNVSVLLNTTAPGAATPSFATRQDFAAGSQPKNVAVGDLNGDGKVDMAVQNGFSNTVSVFLNTAAPGAAAPAFAAKQDFGTGNVPNNVAMGDMNRDGKLDLVVAIGSGSVSVLLNTTAPGSATASFAAKQDFPTPGLSDAIVADFNRDGRLDIATAGTDIHIVSVLMNTTTPGAATPSFAPRQDLSSGTGPKALAAGDLNGDGLLDLAVTAFTAGNVSVFHNTTAIGSATPGFTTKQDFNTGTQPAEVALGDLNGDGNLDLAVTNSGTPNLSVMFNLTAPGAATPSFAAKQDFSTGASPGSITMGDLNGDGKLDLAYTNADPGDSIVSVRFNTTPPGAAMPSFTARQDFATAINPAGVTMGDLNGDGKLDLAVATTATGPNFAPSVVSVLLNTTAPGAATPSFAGKEDFPTDTNLSVSVTMGDLNGDGKLDLAVANAGSGTHTVSVLLNTTAPGAVTPSFAATKNFATGGRPKCVKLGDFNGDGKLDLAASVFVNPSTNNNIVSVLLNTTAPGHATPSFAVRQEFVTGPGPGGAGLTVGDLNGDGKPDLAAAIAPTTSIPNSGNVVAVLVNNTAPGATTASFAARQEFATGSFPGSITLGDLNRDGKPDLAVANFNDNTVSVLLNTPTIVAATGVSRQQGSPTSNSQIAAVTNYGGDGSVIVSVTSANPSNGVTISNIVNTNGNVTANIVAGCAATNATFTLQASDGSSAVTTTLNVGVTANTAPNLTYSTPQSVAFGGALIVNPTTASDNGAISDYAVQSVSPAMTTAPTVNAGGVVSITNAQPAGAHTITIRATDNCGATKDAAFTLNVSKGNQTITVGTHAPANATYNTSFTVAASASSGLPITYSSSGVCANVGATFTMTSGTGTCTVRYDQVGDTNFNAATQVTESVTAQKASTSTALTSSLNPSALAQNVTFTATVTSAVGTPTAGTVQFKIDGANAGSPVLLNGSGLAQITTASLTAGTHTVTADYNGSTNFIASAATLSGGQVVNNRPLLSFAQATYNVDEVTGFIAITVVRTGDLSVPVTVDYATNDNSASIDCSKLNSMMASTRCDFTLTLGTLRFAAGETQKTFTIPITQDSFAEEVELFDLDLSAPTGTNASLTAPSNARVAIADSTPPAPNANDDTTAFVRQQYRDFLAREADPSGLAFWKNNINECNDPARRYDAGAVHRSQAHQHFGRVLPFDRVSTDR